LQKTRSTPNGGIRVYIEKILAVAINRYGYVKLGLYKNGYKNHEVHRLVALAFLKNPNKLPQVNHIDGKRDNNVVTNLEWVSAQDNALHSSKILGYKPKGICVQQLNENGRIVRCYISISDASLKSGVNGISNVLSGKRKTAGGFIWRYANNKEEAA
jgi:hypothetical protein